MAEQGGGFPESYQQRIENLKSEQGSKLSQLGNEISKWLEDLHKLPSTIGQTTPDPFRLLAMTNFVGSLHEWHQKSSLVDSDWVVKVRELKNQITGLVVAAESKVKELDERKNDYNAKLETLAQGIIELKESRTLFATLREDLVAENENLRSGATEDLAKITQLRLHLEERDAEISELKKASPALGKSHRDAVEISKSDAAQAHRVLEEENTRLREQNQKLSAEVQLLKDDMANQVATKIATAKAEIVTEYQRLFGEKIENLDDRHQQLNTHLTIIAEHSRAFSTISDGIKSVLEVTTDEFITKKVLTEKASEFVKEVIGVLATKQDTTEIASRLDKMDQANNAALTLAQLQDILGRLENMQGLALTGPKPTAERRTTSVIGPIEGLEGGDDIESEEAVEISKDADQPVPSSMTTRRLSMRALQTPDLLSPTFPASHPLGTKPQRSTPRSGRTDNPKRLRIGDTASAAEMITSWRRENNILHEQAQKIASFQIDHTVVGDVNQVLLQWDDLRDSHDKLPKRTNDMAIDVLTAEGVQIPSDPAYESENDELAIHIQIHNLMHRVINKIKKWLQVEYESEMVTIEAQQVSDDDALTRTTLTRQDALRILHRQEAFATQSDNRLSMFHAEVVMKEIDGVAALHDRERQVKATAVKICNAARPMTMPGYMLHTQSSRRSMTASLVRQGSFRSRGIVHQSSSSSLAQRSGRTSPVTPKASDVFTDDPIRTPVTVTGAQPLLLTPQLALPSRNVLSASKRLSSRQDRGGAVSPTPSPARRSPDTATAVEIPVRKSSLVITRASAQASSPFDGRPLTKTISKTSLQSDTSSIQLSNNLGEWAKEQGVEGIHKMFEHPKDWDADKVAEFKKELEALPDRTPEKLLSDLDKLAHGLKDKIRKQMYHKCLFPAFRKAGSTNSSQIETRAECPSHRPGPRYTHGELLQRTPFCVYINFVAGLQDSIQKPAEDFDVTRQTVNGIRYILTERK